jgi:hypothetical protein
MGGEMNYQQTLMSRVLSVPSEQWNDNCLYIFILKLPFIVAYCVIGVIVALVVDFVVAICE